MLKTLLAESTYNDIKGAPIEVAVLPFGATEPHNLHLPYGTDTYQVEAIAQRAAEQANRLGARVVVLPAIPFGTQTNQSAFPLAINLLPSTIAAIVKDVVDTLALHGVLKLLILNGHGGNDLKWILRELHGQTPVQLFLCNWWKVAGDRYGEIFEEPGDHAGELETSLMLALRPDLCHPETADAGQVSPSRFEAVQRGWVEITRPWHLLTTNSGSGNPHPASPEKGAQALEIVVDRIGSFLRELSSSPLDDRFPFQPVAGN